MNKSLYRLSTILATGLLLSMQSVVAASKPDWVEGDADMYPNEQYLIATGSASTPELAKDRALGNLVKIFETHVKESTTTQSDTRVQVKNGKENVSKDQRLAQQINIHTDKVVNGARIAESWFDKPVLMHYALAVLDRSQAGNNMRDEMRRLDDETAVELTRSESETDVLLSMSALNHAVQLQREREALQKTLKVIDLSGMGSPEKWNMADLRGNLETKLQSLRIATSVGSDSYGKLDQILRSAMANAGFPSAGNDATYTLVADLETQDLGMREGWYWLRGKLSVKLVEANGKIRGRKEWPLKVSALQRNDAESRMMTQVSQKLNQDLKMAMLSFATADK
ncbi:MAG: LPP20 family lipoprotein [Gammaproteobacteria bacterium]|nr:LPP20 family lipoprotein [Gammaproteobacteria bacterium]